jgi:hypothetical protein
MAAPVLAPAEFQAIAASTSGLVFFGPLTLEWGMTPRIATALVTLLGATLASFCAVAGDCAFLGRDPLTLRDTELFYKSPQSNTWVSLDATPRDGTLASQTVTFAYVIQEKLDQRRSGVVILKSGRNRVASDPAPRVVELVRGPPDDNDDATTFQNGSCGRIPEFGQKVVTASSYDRYHDFGGKVLAAEQTTLDKFHYKYVGRADRCRKTNDTSPDSKIPYVPRNNLGQFSFDPNIVGTSTWSQVVALLGPDQAYAGGSDNLAAQRVELKAYRVRKGFPTCVIFSLNVPDSTGFIRINDLEGLAQSNLDYIRADERSWSLAR